MGILTKKKKKRRYLISFSKKKKDDIYDVFSMKDNIFHEKYFLENYMRFIVFFYMCVRYTNKFIIVKVFLYILLLFFLKYNLFSFFF